MRRFFSLLLTLTLALLGTVPALAEEVAAIGLPDAAHLETFSAADEDPELLTSTVTVNVTGKDNQAEARKLLNMVNAARQAVGVNSLVWDTDLEAAAMQRAAEIAVSFSHTRPNGTNCGTALPSHLVYTGENISAGYANANAANTGWTNSQGHYANMINSSSKSMAAASFIYTSRTGDTCTVWVELFSASPGNGMSGAASTGQHTYSVAVTQDTFALGIAMKQSLYVGDTGTARLWQTTRDFEYYSVELTGSSLVWNSSDTSVLSFGANGAFTANAPGSTTVSVTLGSAMYTFPTTVNVYERPSEETHTVTLVPSDHGTLTSYSGTSFAAGKDVNIFAEPDVGYEVKDIFVKGVGSFTKGPDASDGATVGSWVVSFVMPANDVTVSATFVKEGSDEHAIVVESTTNGTVTPSHKTAAAGSEIALTLTPNAGYVVYGVAVTDSSGTLLPLGGTDARCTFVMPDSDVRVRVTFMRVEALSVIYDSKPDHGTVIVDPKEGYEEGTLVTVTLRPDNGCVLETIEAVNSETGEKLSLGGMGTTRTFRMPNASVRLNVTFKSLNEQGDARFPDVEEGDWFYDAVEWAAEKGVMNGEGDGTYFNPTGTLSRAAMAQLLYNANGQPAADASVVKRFPDCSVGDWYAKAVSWAYTTGAITGYDSGNFGPGDPVTREQFATILWRLEGKPAGTGNLTAFPDERAVSAFSRDALKWAVGEGVITGDGGKLSPGKAITRAEAATMLMRWMA